ncbi:hypothetical protein [Streptomyces sp. NPDC001604]|uniref:hypothetical protein n=1 Tax=Streptomyces sp. NPDC001604 TaxID=3364593 RepID=UPI0036CD88C2
MESLALVIAEPADAGSAQAARFVSDVVNSTVRHPSEQFVSSPVAGVLSAVAEPVVPVLQVEGVPVPLDPADRETLDQITDYLYCTRGSGQRFYLTTLIDNRRAFLSRSYTGDTPPSEPGIPQPAPPHSPAARDAELAALDRLAPAATAAWDRLYVELGVLLELVDASARQVMQEEILKARELADYAKYGLARDKESGQVTVADTETFGRLAAGLRRLAGLRDDLRAAERDETYAGLPLYAAMLTYLLQGSGPITDDPAVQQTGGLVEHAARARIAAALAFADELRAVAAEFPVAWRLEDDLTAQSADDAVLTWVVDELQRTHEALDEIHRGAVLRDPPRFIAQDPLAAVQDDARAEWSVWQYAQVVSLALARSHHVPGSLAWCAAMEVLGRIAEMRTPREEGGGWLFGAALQLLLLIPVVREAVLVFQLLVAAAVAYRNIAEAAHQRTAHLVALDPVSVLAVPDVPLTSIVLTSLAQAGIAALAAAGPLRTAAGAAARWASPLPTLQYYANRTLYACRKFCVGAWFLARATGGGSMQIAYRNRAVIALIEQSRRQAIREMGEIFLEARAEAQAATADVGAAAPAAGQAASDAAEQEVARLVAALMSVTGTATPSAAMQTAVVPPAQGGGDSATRPPASGTVSSTSGAAVSCSIPDIEQLNQNPALLDQVVADVIAMMEVAAADIPADMVEDRAFVRVVVLQMLNAYRTYTSTYTLRRQMAEGISFEEARTLDVDGIVNHIAGKVNELLAIKYGALTSRLMAEAVSRYEAAPAGDWEYPRLAAQMEIDAGNGFRLAQDLVTYSRGTGPRQGLVRIWAWGQITLGDPTHLLTQTESDFSRFGTPGAKILIDGVVYDVEMQVVGGPPLPGALATDTTAIVGSATRAPDVAAGLAGYGVVTQRLPWNAQGLRTIVREVLRRANKLGQ